MKQKKFTVNERINLLEKMTYKLALEIQAIVAAIKMTANKEESKKKTPTFEIIKEVSKRPILTRSVVDLNVEEDKKNK
mgnify:CR=1 FL=1